MSTIHTGITSMKKAQLSTFMKLTLGVDFSYDFCSVTFIEIALSNVAVLRRPTFLHEFVAQMFGEGRSHSTLRSRNRPLGSIIKKLLNHIYTTCLLFDKFVIDSAARFGNLSPFGLLFQPFGDQYFALATWEFGDFLGYFLK